MDEDGDKEVYSREVGDPTLPSMPITRKIKYFYMTVMAFPWALLGLNMLHGISYFVDLVVVSLVVLIAYYLARWIEDQVLVAINGRVINSYLSELLTDNSLRKHWNEVALRRCPEALIVTAEELENNED